MSDELLEKINVRLSALLALAVEEKVQSEETDRRRKRSLDRVLRDAGLTTVEIAALLGKTDRAMRKMLEKDTKSLSTTGSD